MFDAYLYDHVRTPRGKGRKDGRLHQASPVWLLRTLLIALQARNQLDTAQVDDVVVGCVTPVGEQGADIARTAVLDAGWAQTVAGVTQSRFCASGLESVNLAAAKVGAVVEALIKDYELDRANLCLAGGGGSAGVVVPYLGQKLGCRWKIVRNAPIISTIGVALAMVREVVERTVLNPGQEDIASIRQEALERILKSGAVRPRWKSS